MDNCTTHTGLEVEEACTEAGVFVCPLPTHSPNQIQPLDSSAFAVTKRAIARVNRTDTVNVQSDHIAHVVGGFMSIASPSNVAGTFTRAGLVLTLDSDGKLFWRVCPKKAKCFFNPIEAVPEPVPMGEEVEELEHKLYQEHMSEIIIDEMQQISECMAIVTSDWA
jgi:hypothetical protein